MATCAVRNFTSVPDATSESDDEDKLLIVEDDSIPDDPEQKPSVFPLKAVPHVSVTCTEDADSSLGQNGLLQEIRVKEECVSEEDIPEEAGRKKRLDSKRIYSDASKAHQKKQEKGVRDENGTPDDFPQLHTCPHCARGYKRHTSLKEHIKLRHEKNEDNYCCSLCSYSFTYRTQLVRHMTAHRNIQQRNNSQAGGARKFKCTVCSKAFKYKHHLKEHLRIHSGEKPYECSNCQKRFSHSGSYSSHISNMKCATVAPEANSLSHAKERKVSRTRLTQAPLKEKLEISSKPLQEQLPAKQIKQEPVEHQPKLVTANGVVAPVQGPAGQGVVQTLVLPTVGLVHPISINLSDLQNALSAAMEGNVIRQVLTSANTNGGGNKILGSVPTQAQTVVLQPQQTQPQMISAISLPVVGQDGNAKLIINYNPQQVQTVKANVAQTTMATATESVNQPILVQSQAKPSVTEIQTSAKPHVKIIKPVQATNSIKIPSIIKISPEQANRLVQARVAPSKPIQQTFLLVRRADGSQSIVVRQQSIASSKTEGSPAIDSELKSSPEKPANPPTVDKETAEKVSCLEEVCDQPKQDSNVPLDVKIKTEPPSPSVPPNGEKNLMETARSEESIDALTHSGTVHSSVAYGDNFHNYASCLLCDRNTGKQKFLDNQDSDSSDTPTTISLTSLLDKDKSGAAERLLPLLKAYSQNPEPTEEQMSQVAKEVKLPLESIKKWYLKMRSKRILLQSTSSKKKNKETKSSTGESANKRTPPVEDPLDAIENERLPSPLQLSIPGDFVIVKTEDVEEEMQSEPLDLSLPKSSPAEPKQPVSSQKEPLNLTCLKKQPLQGNTVFLTQPGMGPLNIMTGTLPTLVAITEPSGVTRCVRAALSPNKRTIFIPQLTYTYSSATSPDKAPADTKGTVILNNSVVTDSDGVSGVEDQNDEDLQVTKKQRRSLSGLYSCDLCDKIFQKSSSLLRHKYEHTGKRPHECGVCNKAFKHKHHLIEHTRLHSGEKPYQCDKCGKRFSHSGSYSQHMNHRYSYCKRDPHESLEQNTTTPHPAPLDSDERESDGEEEEEEEDLSAYDMSDIRVIRVGEEDEEENAEYEEQVMEEETRPQVMEEEEMLMEVEVEDIHHQEKETIDASFVSHSQTDGCLWD